MGVAELLDRQADGAGVEDGRQDARELREDGWRRNAHHPEVGEVPVPRLDGDNRQWGREEPIRLPDHEVVEAADFVEVAADRRVAAADLDPHRPLEAIREESDAIGTVQEELVATPAKAEVAEPEERPFTAQRELGPPVERTLAPGEAGRPAVGVVGVRGESNVLDGGCGRDKDRLRHKPLSCVQDQEFVCFDDANSI